MDSGKGTSRPADYKKPHADDKPNQTHSTDATFISGYEAEVLKLSGINDEQSCEDNNKSGHIQNIIDIAASSTNKSNEPQTSGNNDRNNEDQKGSSMTSNDPANKKIKPTRDTTSKTVLSINVAKSNESKRHKNSKDNVPPNEIQKDSATPSSDQANTKTEPNRNLSPKTVSDIVTKRSTNLLKRLYCNKCGILFDGFSDFLSHILNPPEEEHVFRCPKCEYKIGNTLAELIQHVKRFCGYEDVTKREQYVALHLPQSISMVRYFCEICCKGYSVLADLITHQEEHSDILFCCSLCNAKTETFRGLMNHFKQHTVSFNVELTCIICSLRFYSSTPYKLHYYLVHSQLLNIPFECSLCPRVVVDDEDKFVLHVQSHCEFSEKKFNPAGRPTCPDVAKYTCEVCAEMFITTKACRSHRKDIHNLDDNILEVRQCPLCQEEIAFSAILSHLNGHQKKRFINLLTWAEKEKPVKCPECDKVFISDRCLADHSVSHQLQNISMTKYTVTSSNKSNGRANNQQAVPPIRKDQIKTLVTRTNQQIYPATVRTNTTPVATVTNNDDSLTVKQPLLVTTDSSSHFQSQAKCSDCDKNFISLQALKDHTKLHYKEWEKNGVHSLKPLGKLPLGYQRPVQVEQKYSKPNDKHLQVSRKESVREAHRLERDYLLEHPHYQPRLYLQNAEVERDQTYRRRSSSLPRHQHSPSPSPPRLRDLSSPLPPKRLQSPSSPRRQQLSSHSRRQQLSSPPRRLQSPSSSRRRQSPVAPRRLKSSSPPRHQQLSSPPRRRQSQVPPRRLQSPSPPRRQQLSSPPRRLQSPLFPRGRQSSVSPRHLQSPSPPRHQQLSSPPRRLQSLSSSRRRQSPVPPRRLQSPSPSRHQQFSSPPRHLQSPSSPRSRQSPLPSRRPQLPLPRPYHSPSPSRRDYFPSSPKGERDEYWPENVSNKTPQNIFEKKVNVFEKGYYSKPLANYFKEKSEFPQNYDFMDTGTLHSSSDPTERQLSGLQTEKYRFTNQSTLEPSSVSTRNLGSQSLEGRNQEFDIHGRRSKSREFKQNYNFKDQPVSSHSTEYSSELKSRELRQHSYDYVLKRSSTSTTNPRSRSIEFQHESSRELQLQNHKTVTQSGSGRSRDRSNERGSREFQHQGYGPVNRSRVQRSPVPRSRKYRRSRSPDDKHDSQRSKYPRPSSPSGDKDSGTRSGILDYKYF